RTSARRARRRCGGLSSDRPPMKALIITVDMGEPDYAAHSDEFRMLAEGAGAEIVATLQVRRGKPDAAHFIGSGKLEEASQLVHALQPDVILFDRPLSPAQQRNIERVLN